MNKELERIAGLDRLIHEPARLMILFLLSSCDEADFTWLQNQCGFTQGNLSGHLARLEGAGYIAIEKSFRGKLPLTVCRLTRDGQAAFRAYCSCMQQIFNSA